MEITTGEALARLIAMGADAATYDPDRTFWRKSERALHHGERYCSKNRQNTWNLERHEAKFSAIKPKRLCPECGLDGLSYNLRVSVRTVKDLLAPLALLNSIAERSKTDVDVSERGNLYVRSFTASHNVTTLAATLADDLHEVREEFLKEAATLLAAVRKNLQLDETRQLHERRCRLNVMVMHADGPHNIPYLTNADATVLDSSLTDERRDRLWRAFTSTAIREDSAAMAHANVLQRAAELPTGSVILPQLSDITTDTVRGEGESFHDYVSRTWKTQVFAVAERLADRWREDWERLGARTRDSLVAIHRTDVSAFTSHLSELIAMSTINDRGSDVVLRVNEVTAELVMARTQGSSWRNVASTVLLDNDDDSTIQTAIALWSPADKDSSYRTIDAALHAARQL
jgi:hypothetical protein